MFEDHKHSLSLLASEIITVTTKIDLYLFRPKGHSDITSLDFSSVFDTVNHVLLFETGLTLNQLSYSFITLLFIGCLVLLGCVEGGDFKEKLFLEILLEFLLCFLKVLAGFLLN